MSNNSITKSNALIEAGYRLSLTEIQIVLYGISLVNPTAEECPLEFKIDIKRFAEMFNRDHGDIYREVKQAVLSKFWERDFSFKDEKENVIKHRWLITVKYQDKTGYLNIVFHDAIRPYLHQLKKNFTTYYINQISQFKSVYAVRLYEISIMYLNKYRHGKSSFFLRIMELKERLEISDKYKRFSNFKTFVLEPAKKEINKHSDIKFNYKVKKLGRSPHEIEFTVSKKQKAQSEQPKLSEYKPTELSPAVFEKAKKIAQEAGNRWDIYAIEQQFHDYVKKKGQPESLENAFIGFVRKKVATIP